ncbi:hypothetical protein [Nostoc sphaeroides]|uniref:Uncharacterized protein n=1 Tax=Nostoc sphaeroides CCNUC1 TaxID=2653204 RepID=A0A5P8WBT2_9NOSO|nr:hypothetical protein [Nostoc sphaeroides]QFS50263.1 hypothetical protein GXM_07757 [Nostoc sphaeroides CCNUC1]
MQAKSNPLFVIINPPGIQYGMPGQIVEIHVVVINEGQQSAVIDLFFTFDETFQKISNWSSSPRASLAIAPGQSSDEVKFELQIPVNALPGTYDYTFVVDSPEHYPQDTPINFPGQIKVLLNEQTVIRANDPTFSIQPATNPNKPLIYKSDQLLQVTVKVDNRSPRVDRFHLTCPDLDEEWFRISYPVTGLEAAGLVEVNALELNPMSQGQILLEFRPIADTLAGNYSPTIRLHSENNPDLVLLDLVYIYIPANYQLAIELNTILGKVSHNPGKYQLALMNQGNLVRELYFSARSRDEEELCIYQFEPTETKLLPSRSVEVNLAVKPRPWWRQPWVGQPLIINFQVDVTDKQNLPISSTLHQGVLVWKARPWWQFLLLMLVGFGLIATAAFLIWRLLNPDPLKIENFSTENPTLIEGDEVRLNWKIDNYKQLKRLVIKTQQPPSNEPIFDDINISKLIKKGTNDETASCQITSQEELICNRFVTGIKTKGKYVFEIKASYNKRKSFFSQETQTVTQTADVEIAEKPIAEIIGFNTDKPRYNKGENIVLTWSIKRPELLDRIELFTTKDDDKILVEKPISFKFKNSAIDDPKFKNKCQQENNQNMKCVISVMASQAGIFSYDLKAYSLNISDRVNTKASENKVEILAKPFKIIFFKINNNDQPNQVLNEGENAILSWKVEGENIEVKLLPYGDKVPQVGSKNIVVIKNFPTQLALQVNDISGKQQPQQKGFAITVNEIQPTPNPLISPLNPIFPIPSPKNKPLY